MPIRFNCQNPNCPHPALKVGDQYAGQRAQCPNCETINIVPMQEELVLPPLPPPPDPPYRSPLADIFEANGTASSTCPLFDVNTQECAYYCSPTSAPSAWSTARMLINIENWCLGSPSKWSDCGAYKNYQKKMQ